MDTVSHSFMDIFQSDSSDETTPDIRRIVIPIIQRDYAQGRRDPDVDRVRARFLDALRNAIVNEPITLDFVYGDVNADGVLTPLDGQQRLTTLFLLHWYAAKRDGVPDEECAFLLNFGYETRYSARNFCNELARFSPTFERRLSEEVIDQAWFPLDWLRDPTISSMLVMLDAIDEKFRDVEDLWNRLKCGAITFYFLPIRDMGLTDELYIKMNSRGKPLTRFEHFKAELERCIRTVSEESADRIARKIDRDWTDLLWRYRDSGEGRADDQVTDDEFLRYFRFACDILCYRNGKSPQRSDSDVFDLLATYFTGESEQVLGNVRALESFFDCWCHIDGHADPTDFLRSCMSHKHEVGKIVVDNANAIDIFEDCLRTYSERSGRQRRFPLNRLVLLYAITVYLRHQDAIAWDDYVRRLRCINNLIQNSEDEVSDRADRNRIPAILIQVDAIMLTGSIDDAIDNNFNVNQITEEKEKRAFLEKHPEKTELVFALEDHSYLRGQIGIVGLDHIDYADRFASLFACDWDEIDCAMMSIGDYGQMERNGWRYQYASCGMQTAWTELFHKSASHGFGKTSAVLVELLSKAESFTNELLRQISEEFIASCEEEERFPWRYYYVKYRAFRPGSFGKYSNRDAKGQPYLFAVMQTKSHWSPNTYMPFLKEADEEHLSRDDMGQRLIYGDKHVICLNDGFQIRDNESEEVVDTVHVRQDEDGIDVEDRVLVLRGYLEEAGLL